MEALILASASVIRRRLLEQAGVAVTIEPAAVDETAIKESCRRQGTPIEICAEILAEMKAQRISKNYPEALVLGADQMLECGDVWFDKPSDRAAAAAQLRDLRGNTHVLMTSIVAMRGGRRLWHCTDRARLTMRCFSDEFLSSYLDRAGDLVLASVGAYQLEGLGAQLFDRIQGDYFTILGLPLLPLLDFLRSQGIVRP
jgi:septum formation protein